MPTASHLVPPPQVVQIVPGPLEPQTEPLFTRVLQVPFATALQHPFAHDVASQMQTPLVPETALVSQRCPEPHEPQAAPPAPHCDCPCEA